LNRLVISRGATIVIAIVNNKSSSNDKRHTTYKATAKTQHADALNRNAPNDE